MNIKEAKEEILHTIQIYTRKDAHGQYLMPSVRQRPVLLIGPPGIGKTAIMEQISRECGIGLTAYTITHHTRQSAVGLPVIVKKNYQGKEYSITEYTMSEIIASVYETIEKSGCQEGILFIDEINCVSETLVPTMLQFLQNKTFGTHPVPEGWVIVAAGNPVEYNKSAREFDIVTLDRVKRIDVEPDLAVWKEYAWAKGIHPAILSYLSLHNDRFYHVENTASGVRFVTARGWEDLSSILYGYEDLDLTPDADLVLQYLQEPETARDLPDIMISMQNTARTTGFRNCSPAVSLRKNFRTAVISYSKLPPMKKSLSRGFFSMGGTFFSSSSRKKISLQQHSTTR